MRMRHSMLFLLVLVIGSSDRARAQVVTNAEQAEEDSVPATPRKPSPVHFLFFGVQQSASVRTAAAGIITESNVGLTGVELLLQPRKGGVGMTARMLGRPDELNYLDGSILLGTRVFSVDLAYVMRAGPDPLVPVNLDSTYSFGRAGVRSRANLGHTGFTLNFRAGYYVPIPEVTAKVAGLEGWEGETGLSWTWSRFPLTAALGYRLERFKIYSVEQEVSALTLGVGVAFGRR